MSEDPEYSVIDAVELAKGSTIYDQVNLYGCEIGDNTKIDAFVYIEENVVIGDNCIIRPFTFIPKGIKIGDRVFIGPNVTFTNDMYPGVGDDWELLETMVEDGVAIGAGAVICPGVTLGEDSSVGAGTVVTDNVAPNAVVVGNPERRIDD